MKLARALVKAAEKTGKLPKLFVQVNTGKEPQKAGVHPENLDEFLSDLKREYDITPAGLMCIPPAFDPSRRGAGQAPGPHFALLAKMAERHGITQLSMGMSADFEVAIEFGATSVRIGSAVFGARP